MSIPTAPTNHLFVLIDKMYVDEIQSGNGVKIFTDSTFNPEWNATITGDVVSCPMKLTQDIIQYERRGLVRDDVRPGDEVIFKYLVVEDKEHYEDPSAFYRLGPDTEDSKEMEFENSNKDLLRIFVLGKNWGAACLQDKTGEIIGGINGKRKEVEKWMMQFKFLGDGELAYKNLMIHEGVMYWKVDYTLIIGVIRNEMVGEQPIKRVIPGRGYIFIEPVEIDLGELTEGGIIIPEYMRKSKSRRLGIARHIGQPRVGEPKMDLNPDEFVVWDERYSEQYEIGGIPWIVLQHKYVQGKMI